MTKQVEVIGAVMQEVTFDNGTAIAAAFPGTVTQWRSEMDGLRAYRLPAEEDTSPEFRSALQALGIREQETIHLDVNAASRLRAYRPAGRQHDRVVLRPASGAKRGQEVKVVLYQDEAGAISWHFPDGFFDKRATSADSATKLRAPLDPVFTIETRTAAAQKALQEKLPPTRLRGIITKLGRKVFKVLIVPLSRLASPAVEAIVGAVERKRCQQLVRLLTPVTYRQTVATPFTDWPSLAGKRALLVIHGIFSSCEGMLGGLPPQAMEDFCRHYEGRVLGYNHWTASRTPEQNARDFFALARAHSQSQRVEFDILCHSRGGIVARALAERGELLAPGHNCDFRRVFFVATPNQGSPLADADHIVDMLDVFTNLLTHFPDGPTLYSLEVVLSLVKLLAYTFEQVPGLADMGTQGYIAATLNASRKSSPAAYAAATSNYTPDPKGHLLGVNGYIASYIMEKVFTKGGTRILNDLVVPEEGVYAANEHPSFPIADPLVFDKNDHIWHTAFFAQPRTVERIAQHFGIILSSPSPAHAAPKLRRPSAGRTGQHTVPPLRDPDPGKALDDLFEEDEEDSDSDDTDEAFTLPQRSGGTHSYAPGGESGFEAGRDSPLHSVQQSGDAGRNVNPRPPGGLRQYREPSSPPFSPSSPVRRTTPASRRSAAPPTEWRRNPVIDFRESVVENAPTRLTARLEEVTVEDMASAPDAFALTALTGQTGMTLRVTLSAPGFDVKPRQRLLTVQSPYDSKRETVTFLLTARSVTQTTPRTVRADFWLGSSCLGSVAYATQVVSARQAARAVQTPAPPGNRPAPRPLAISHQRRKDCQWTLCIEGQNRTGRSPFEMRLSSDVSGFEFDYRDMGVFTVPGDDLAQYLNTAYQHHFNAYPEAPQQESYVGQQGWKKKYKQALQKWEANYNQGLDALGRTLWTFLPQTFRDEYFRFYQKGALPESIMIVSDEMLFPWELVTPHDYNASRQPLVPLGIAHILGRWKPGLSFRPSPQNMRIEEFCILNPVYAGENHLPWAQEEVQRLKKLLPGVHVVHPADTSAFHSLLARDNVQLLHFSGHGEYDPRNADLSALRLQDNGTFEAMQIVGTPLAGLSCPLVYLNACSVGRSGPVAGHTGGFAARCVENGCSGVIAPYWPVFDDRAAEFSLALYDKLLQGRSVGEALQELRADHPNDSTYRAFAYFGDPWTRATFALPKPKK